MSGLRKERFKKFLGPYDLNVGLIYSAFLTLNIFQLRPETYRYAYGYPRIQFFFSSVLIILILSIPFLALLLLSKWYWKRHKKSLRTYLLEIAQLTFVSDLTYVLAAKYLVPILGVHDFLRIDNFLFIYVTRTIFIFLFISFTHNREKILKKELTFAEELNKQLIERYATLIEMDEEIRSQAAKLLHDRIQSDLMLATSQLGMIAQTPSIDTSPKIREVQKSLEHIRAIDLRNVSQLLTPNLEGEGLIGSCENLFSNFTYGIKIDLKIDEDLENLDNQLKLGIYRIIEQGINNSIKHGPAELVLVKLLKTTQDNLVLEIIDNGSAAAQTNIGTGTIVIDAWVSSLNATKQIEAIPGVGYTLRVTIPLA
jgi:signal transduction histidine kinase